MLRGLSSSDPDLVACDPALDGGSSSACESSRPVVLEGQRCLERCVAGIVRRHIDVSQVLFTLAVIGFWAGETIGKELNADRSLWNGIQSPAQGHSAVAETDVGQDREILAIVGAVVAITVVVFGDVVRTQIDAVCSVFVNLVGQNRHIVGLEDVVRIGFMSQPDTRRPIESDLIEGHGGIRSHPPARYGAVARQGNPMAPVSEVFQTLVVDPNGVAQNV